jgi:carbon-monoxide dehydrogenase medium subunit
MALGAEVVLRSAAGERTMPLRDFYTGFRKTAIQPNELLREIRLPALQEHQRGLFIKLGLRRAQAISVIDLAIVLTLGDGRWEMGDGANNPQLLTPNPQSPIADARITLGCLAPTIVHAPTAEAYLCGKRLTPDVCAEAGRLACADVAPIDDVRGSASYRLATLANLVADGLLRIAENRERAGWPERPVLLETDEGRSTKDERRRTTDHRPLTTESSPVVGSRSSVVSVIETTINGQRYALAGAHTKSLLDALREDAGLTGCKEGCAEGECGACTVWLNGQAVMACLVPAPQAQGSQIVTIEGLAATRRRGTGHGTQDTDGQEHAPVIEHQASESDTIPQLPTPNPQPPALHPLQQAFIDNAAVQCGYCIPGMLMAGAKLLDEQAHPSLDQIQTALSGNICRCTGYRKILDAVLAAAAQDDRL